jgi:hypothetical protein
MRANFLRLHKKYKALGSFLTEDEAGKCYEMYGNEEGFKNYTPKGFGFRWNK